MDWHEEDDLATVQPVNKGETAQPPTCVLELTVTVPTRHVPGTGFGNGASTLKQHFVLPKNGSKYYLKYTFLAFPVLGIFGLGTSLVPTRCSSLWYMIERCAAVMVVWDPFNVGCSCLFSIASVCE